MRLPFPTLAATAGTPTNVVFFPENVDEHFVSKSLWVEVHSRGMSFVVETIHDPGGQEGHPPDEDHHLDLVLCQHMGEAVDIYQPHVGGHTCQSCYCQSA